MRTTTNTTINAINKARELANKYDLTCTTEKTVKYASAEENSIFAKTVRAFVYVNQWRY